MEQQILKATAAAQRAKAHFYNALTVLVLVVAIIAIPALLYLEYFM